MSKVFYVPGIRADIGDIWLNKAELCLQGIHKNGISVVNYLYILMAF